MHGRASRFGVTTSDQFICDDGIGTCTYDGDNYDDEMDDYYYDGGGHYGNPYQHFDAATSIMGPRLLR